MPASESSLTISLPRHAQAQAQAAMEPVVRTPTTWDTTTGARDRALAAALAFGNTGFAVSSGFNRYRAEPVPPRGVLRDNNLCEVIPPVCHPFADVEWIDADVARFNHFRREPKDVIDTVGRAAVDILGEGPLTAQIMCASGITPAGVYKHSFHFVWPRVVIGFSDAKTFGDDLADSVSVRLSVPVGTYVDTSVYNGDSHLMRMLYQSKLKEAARTFQPYGDSSPNVEDHLIGVYTADARAITWRAPPVSAAAVARRHKEATADDTAEWRELVAKCVGMLNVTRADSYEPWKDTCWALKNIGASIGEPDAFKDVWTAFSARSAKFDAAATEAKWKDAREHGLGLGSLRKWACEDNPVAYAPVKRAFGRMFFAAKGEAEEVTAEAFAASIAAMAPAAPPPTEDGDDDTAYGGEGGAAGVDEAAKGIAALVMETLDAALDNIVTWGGAHQPVAHAVRVMVGGKLVHLEKEKWCMFSDKGTGARWDVETDVNIHVLFHEDLDGHLARRIAFWDANATEPREIRVKTVKMLTDTRHKLRTSAYASSCIAMLKSLVSDRLFMSKLDANPGLLGFNDGVFDLRAGAFRPARPDDFVSRTVGYDFPGLVDDDVYAPAVDKTLKSIFDPELLEYVMRVYAEQASGALRFESFYILTGSGGNGKGVLQSLLMSAFGMADERGYFTTVKPSMWTGKDTGNGEGASPAKAALRGVRLTFASEPEAGSKLQAGAIKSVTGRDPIAARELYGAPFSFTPQCDINVMCNEIPDLSAIDGGMVRRLNVIAFKHQFGTPEQAAHDPSIKIGDNDLKIRIANDRGYGMALMRMLLRVYEANKGAASIPPPPEVAAATARFLRETDPVGSWFAEKYVITRDKDHRVGTKELFEAYKADTGDRGMAFKPTFGREFARVFGVTPDNEKDKVIKSHGVMKYFGIQRIPDAEEVEAEDEDED